MPELKIMEIKEAIAREDIEFYRREILEFRSNIRISD
jgi:hypothetical protein